MQVILLERISKLGDLGEKVVVKPGFGRNYLIPKGKALAATPANVALFEARRAELHAQAMARVEATRTRAATLEGLSIRLVANAGEEGKLFGSIGAQDIVAALQELGHTLERHEVRFVSGPIRHVGEHEVALSLLGDEVVVALQVTVTGA